MKRLRILPSVLTDISESAAWYDEHGYVGLSHRFIESFYQSLPLLQENGDIYRDFRRILIPPFPYFVYYVSQSDLVIVTLVIHTSRRPSLTRTLLNQRAQDGTSS